MTPAEPGPRCAIHPAVAALGACGRCGTFICAQCQARAPELACEKCSTLVDQPATPWERRQELGLAMAFVQTWWAVMISPRQFYRQLKQPVAVRTALLYAAVVLLASRSLSLALEAAFIVSGPLPAETKPAALGRLVVDAGMRAPLVLLGPALLTVLVHGGARLTAAHRVSFGSTVAVFCYALSPLMFAPLGCVAGGAAALPLSMLLVVSQVVLAGIGVVSAFGARPARAILGMLLPPILLLCCFVALYNFFSASGP